MLICSMMRFISFFTAGVVWCLYGCGCPWSVCEVVLVPYVDAVVAVTVMWVVHVFRYCVYRAWGERSWWNV